MIWGISNTEYSLEIGFKIHKSYVTCSFIPIVWHEFSIGKISGRVSLTLPLVIPLSIYNVWKFLRLQCAKFTPNDPKLTFGQPKMPVKLQALNRRHHFRKLIWSCILETGDSFDERLQAAYTLLENVPLIDAHNDLPYNIRKFVHNQLSEFNFDVDLKNVPPWSNSNWSHTDLQRLKKGRVASQVKCFPFI